MNRAGWDVVDFSLKDRLSDSRLIGAIITKFARRNFVCRRHFCELPSLRERNRGRDDIESDRCGKKEIRSKRSAGMLPEG